MTYRKLIELKFKKGYSTLELIRRFPREAKKVTEVALLQVPRPLLKKMASDGVVPGKLMNLKRKVLEEG